MSERKFSKQELIEIVSDMSNTMMREIRENEMISDEMKQQGYFYSGVAAGTFFRLLDEKLSSQKVSDLFSKN